MQRSLSLTLTFGLAALLAATLWPEERDEPTPRSTNVKTDVTASEHATQGPRSLRGSDPPEGSPRPVDARAMQGPGAGHELPARSREALEGLPEAVHLARVEAFRGWQDHAQDELMSCLPAWTEAGEPRPVLVRFRPDDDSEGEPSARVRAATVAPLDPDVEVPPQVRACLDRLLGTEIALPQTAPESKHGHQEIIHVMWG